MESYLFDIDVGAFPLIAVFGSQRIRPGVSITYGAPSVQGTVLGRDN